MASVRASGVVTAVLVALAMPAEAAVRACKAPVRSATVVADDEHTARKGALAGWMAKVAGLGIAFTSWRLADAKSVTCTRNGNGHFACIAEAAPCRIEQVPPDLDRKPARPAQTASSERTGTR